MKRKGCLVADDEIYHRLAAHLDRLPGGFAPGKTGAETRLLAKLFSPEEAELATYLTLATEQASVIAPRAGLATEEAEQRLGQMARKGLIFSVYRAEAPRLYRAAAWYGGIEFQAHTLSSASEGSLRADEDYHRPDQPGSTISTRGHLRTAQDNGLMRTIPIGKSVEAHRDVLPYEQVYELVRARNRFGVVNCLCRHEAKRAGGL